ncbi:type IV pilus assembly protein PilP [Sinobacterium caligoides]|uniref:Type IV pilus assembly protein PilP n=1 Tax=Sinobacterium caligoides TaxID=933926 RepID=A0A3N2DQ44_9GAMM|nr:pilus assembly protein PilP [Sinobacterium caligoides]ROS01954.1 type IV pilus assembly protein PilP [Sinobacterium caligoides]
MTRRLLTVASALLVISGCANDDFSDLQSYMTEVKNKPLGAIEAIPVYPPYKTYTYSSAARRSPFVKPVSVQDIARLSLPRQNVAPDFNRQKEPLESFSIDDLKMVGTMTYKDVLWALVDDGSGGVTHIKAGGYMGRNHGRVVDITVNQIAVMEIVANGNNGWAERPRTINLKEE